MTGTRVKVFHNDSDWPDDVYATETAINEWLAEKGDSIEVLSLSLDVTLKSVTSYPAGHEPAPGTVLTYMPPMIMRTIPQSHVLIHYRKKVAAP